MNVLDEHIRAAADGSRTAAFREIREIREMNRSVFASTEFRYLR